MGLDMYLHKRTYVKYSDNLELKLLLQKSKSVDVEKVSYIVEEVGYWRKANMIHKWFVDQVQDGNDDCKEYYVPYSKLLELQSLCKKVLKTKDASLLPPTEGFFFGSTDVDEYYFEDLRKTIEIISSLDKRMDYYYRASW